MLRSIHLVIVALLMFSASGVTSLVMAEPCSRYEQREREDGTCPPTCVTCGCCAQAAEPVMLTLAISLEAPLEDVRILTPPLPSTSPGDILHVPKP